MCFHTKILLFFSHNFPLALKNKWKKHRNWLKNPKKLETFEIEWFYSNKITYLIDFNICQRIIRFVRIKEVLQGIPARYSKKTFLLILKDLSFMTDCQCQPSLKLIEISEYIKTEWKSEKTPGFPLTVGSLENTMCARV